jgi:hypothetical protein
MLVTLQARGQELLPRPVTLGVIGGWEQAAGSDGACARDAAGTTQRPRWLARR